LSRERPFSMTAKESESEAALEIAIETYVAGTERALREFVTARYAASILKNAEEARKAQQEAREARSRVEAHLKAEFDNALRLYLQESSQRISGEFRRS
jgi:hypothetical protein